MLVALCAGVLATGAMAQFRTIPTDAVRGDLSHVMGSIVTIDGKHMRLAPGAQIRGQNNLIVTPSAVAPESLVEYTLDRNRDIDKVWILTPAEAARPNRNSPSVWRDGGPAGTPIREILPQAPATDAPRRQ